MSERYRLVFTGEVADGQHPAVVKKRLATVLKLDEARMDALFSGKSVVVKKAVDKKTAARYQQMFQQTGARLRVLAIEEERVSPGHQQNPTSSPSAESGQERAAPGVIQMLPAGSDVLTENERMVVTPAQIDTNHLSDQGGGFSTHEPEVPVDVPDVDHMTLAELGVIIDNSDEASVVVEIGVEFDLAEVGTRLLEEHATDDLTSPVQHLDFDLADVGADMDTGEKAPAPSPPDTSHIELADD